MRKIAYILCLLPILVGVMGDVYAVGRKKKEKEQAKEEMKSEYQKFFENKNAETVKGLMVVHKMNGKVYVEFPLRLLNREMLLASSIADISDNGEGVVGQFAAEPQTVMFTRNGNTINARMIKVAKVENQQDREPVKKAIEQSAMPGITHSLKIEVFTPDSSAVVLDMTPFFMEHTVHTNPFSSYAANSKWGFVYRDHKYRPERGMLRGIKANGNSIAVTCQLGYDVDYIIIGMFLGSRDLKVSATIDKMLLLLPEEPMMPRLADSRVGVSFIPRASFEDGQQGLQPLYLTKRWRLEPENRDKYGKGELVAPKKPIVFYIDSLMPGKWKKYIREGVEEWNKAFERIGFKNAVQAKEFPKDPAFDALDINHSVIRYAPTSSWMYSPQNSMHVDIRTGEILNASIYMHHNMLSTFYRLRVIATMATDPEVRATELPDHVMGGMIRNYITREVGVCLGLANNYKASSAYPVDSLRSASFTRKYGLSPSVMDDVPCNYVAQPDDVRDGACLTQNGIGEYDYFLIKWLYQPIMDAKTSRDERATLDHWIKESRENPYCRFGRDPFIIASVDPGILPGDLGDDQVKVMKYKIANLKIAYANFDKWFAKNDKTLDMRSYLYNLLSVSLSGQGLKNLGAYIGGFYVNEVMADENLPAYRVVPKAKQREVIRFLLDQAKDLSWIERKDFIRQIPMRAPQVNDVRVDIINTLFSRTRMVALSAEKSKEGYQPEEYMDELYRIVWEGTLKKRPLDKVERDLQMVFLAAVIATSTVADEASVIDPSARASALVSVDYERLNRFLEGKKEFMPEPPNAFDNNLLPSTVEGFYAQYGFTSKPYPQGHLFYRMLLKIETLLKETVSSSSGDTRLHYEYLLYKIKKSKEIQ
ncbi:zinc-dependent metalloprotease [Butyricimonas synergistica]|uniref:zinc-dependent metalloprotease n=1 Tax=Butyricimonas synergistica TaxID=544644 RepID=UPI00035FE4F4|nr:zinc-dependent metalloprotease [Butyricimonas synergistica]